MNIGNVLFKLNALLLVLFCFAVINDKIKAMRIMARVLVNLTVTALSSVELPSPHILSHVAAAAVTDDASLIAVPVKIPKASPLTVENPNILPKIGNKIAARALKKNITDIDWDISSSFAVIIVQLQLLQNLHKLMIRHQLIWKFFFPYPIISS